MDRKRTVELERALRSKSQPSTPPYEGEFGNGPGVSDEEFALDRALRSIAKIAEGAIAMLIELGWNRKGIALEVMKDDPLPCWVTLRRKRVFEVTLSREDDGRVVVSGEWVDGVPPSPGIIDRFMGH